MATQTAAERIAELEAQVAALKAGKGVTPSLSMKVSEKGALSVYGLGRFPVTLYPQQWARLAEAMPRIAEFASAHASEFSVKE